MEEWKNNKQEIYFYEARIIQNRISYYGAKIINNMVIYYGA